MAIPLIAPALALIGSGVAKMLVDRLLFFLALKALLIFLFIIVTPIILNNILHDFLQIGTDALDAAASGAVDMNGSMSISGLAAWLADIFKLPECLSIYISAVQLNLTLKLIPFSPVK